MTDPTHQLPPAWKHRLHIVALVAFLLLVLLTARLFQMQVVFGESYQRRAVVNTVRQERIHTVRGKIFDVRGRALVLNEARFDLRIVPAELHNNSYTVSVLAGALNQDPERLRSEIRRHSSSPLEPFVLTTMDPAQFARVAEIQPDLPGITLEARPLRRYPFGLSASHLLGVVGEVSAEELKASRTRDYAEGDVVGKDGLEKQYERELRGQKGTRFISMDAAGGTLNTAEGTPPVPGLDLHLTVDMHLQQRVEDALQNTLDSLEETNKERCAGAIVLMGAQTGEILSLVSLPTFDPNLFSQGITEKEYDKLLTNSAFPLMDRATSGAYPPGSTFKLITAAASLQEGLCDRNTVFHCSGHYEVAGQVFNCFVRGGHGNIDFVNALGQSCDVVFYQLGHSLGIERLARYAGAFGIGKLTGIDLPHEEPGLLPDGAWKQRKLHEAWYEGDTVNMAIGQGYLGATPLQMAVATAAVANGGTVYRPFLVKSITRWDHKVHSGVAPLALSHLPIDAGNLESVRAGMAAAVEWGTAKLANGAGVSIAGKTGTVENYPTSDNPHGRNHAWFVGFAPADKPEIVVVVFLEKSGGLGGKLAAPIARDIVQYYYDELRTNGKPPE